jgi:Mg-chelatase subunit ChlD
MLFKRLSKIILMFVMLTLLAQWQGDSPCPVSAQGSCQSGAVDVVFIMDTSGSMDDEFDALCGNIQAIVTNLQGRGIQVNYKIYGISGNRNCTTGYITQDISGATAIHEEDWGPAVRDVAVAYPWQAGATRLIIPMSDEGPFEGDSCDDPGLDREVVDVAANAARRNGVRVSPILGTPDDQSQLPCINQLANNLAQTTGGQVFLSTTPANDLADAIATTIQTTACDTDGDGVPDTQDPMPNDPCQPNIQAVCLPPQSCGLTNTPHWDDDKDGRIDEELPDSIDNDGDGLIDEDVGGTNCPFPDQSCGVNNHRNFDDDQDGRVDEEQDDGVDNDGDSYVDEDVACSCPVQQDKGINNNPNVDDDGDFQIDEELDNGVDDDGDGCIDEDIQGNIGQPPSTGGCPPPQTETTMTAGVDDDGDGRTDEEFADGFDNDEDGCVDEDVTGKISPSHPGTIITVEPIQPVTPPQSNIDVTTVLALDISGSMANPWKNKTKIQAAHEAARKVIDIIKLDNLLSRSAASDQVVIVTFSDQASLVFGPDTDYNAAQTALNNLTPQQKTNIGAGLETANQALSTVSGGHKTIFLLSDGQPTVGLNANQIIDNPVKIARQNNTCIHTIGFGEPGDLDEGLLSTIANESGCGHYFNASLTNYGLLALENAFIRSRHASVRNILAEFGGEIKQGETTPPQAFIVPPNQEAMVITINWPGSNLELVVTNPVGQTVDPTQPDTQLQETKGLKYLIVKNPIPGEWKTSVYGDDIPTGTTAYNTIISSHPSATTYTPQSGGSGFGPALLVIIVLVAGSIPFFMYLYKRQSTSAGRAGIRVLSGQASPSWMPMQNNQLTMGRSQTNHLIISDKGASRQHARIVQIQQGYLLEDLGSTHGTLVNGKRETRRMLLPGDVIQIGQTQLRFEA